MPESVAQTKARFTGPPGFAGRATPSPANSFSRITNHETRITAFISRREFPGFHETRPFFESRPFCRVGRPPMREGGQARRLQGGMYEARENEWKGVFLNPETGITTYTESGFGSRPGISHNIPQCVGKIRISPCRQSSVPEHCGSRGIGLTCMSHHVARRRANGPRIASHALSSSSAVRHFFWSKPDSHQWFSRNTRHETRITAFFRITAFYPPRCPVHHCSLLFSKKILSRQVSPHRQPFSKGLAARSRRLPGSLGCGDDRMTPC